MIGWIASLVLAAAPGPVVVGVAVAPDHDYARGLLLWQEETNDGGGLLGRRVELRLLDDKGDALRARALYEELLREQKTDLLIGPYGSAASVLAAGEAERARRVLINGGGPAAAVHRRARRYVFQTVAPYAVYGEAIIELAAQAGCRTLHIAGRSDAASAEMTEAAEAAANRRGFELRGAGHGAQGWIVFGAAHDVPETMLALKRQSTAPRFFFHAYASQPRFMELAGSEAEGAFGVARYDVRLPGAANQRFVKAYETRWLRPPGVAAAEGYVAATVLAAGVRRAGTLETEKLRAALAALEADTVLGAYKVNPANGVQTGIKPALTQIVNGRALIVRAPGAQTAGASLTCH